MSLPLKSVFVYYKKMTKISLKNRKFVDTKFVKTCDEFMNFESTLRNRRYINKENVSQLH